MRRWAAIPAAFFLSWVRCVVKHNEELHEVTIRLRGTDAELTVLSAVVEATLTKVTATLERLTELSTIPDDARTAAGYL
jgi:hypothetical protein